MAVHSEPPNTGHSAMSQTPHGNEFLAMPFSQYSAEFSAAFYQVYADASALSAKSKTLPLNNESELISLGDYISMLICLVEEQENARPTSPWESCQFATPANLGEAWRCLINLASIIANLWGPQAVQRTKSDEGPAISCDQEYANAHALVRCGFGNILGEVPSDQANDIQIVGYVGRFAGIAGQLPPRRLNLDLFRRILPLRPSTGPTTGRICGPVTPSPPSPAQVGLPTSAVQLSDGALDDGTSADEISERGSNHSEGPSGGPSEGPSSRHLILFVVVSSLGAKV